MNAIARNDDRFHPQMREALRKNTELQPPGVVRDNLPIDEVREVFAASRVFWNENPIALPAIEDIVLPYGRREIPARCYRGSDADNLPVIVYFHGGGWVLGSNDTHDPIMRRLARSTSALLVSIDYSLAPENPFPAAFDEACHAIKTIPLKAGSLGGNPEAVFVGGDSAGANLAITGGLQVAQTHPDLIKGAVSLYGVMDADLDSPSFRDFGDGTYGLSRDRMQLYWDYYVPDAMDRLDPRVDPCRANLARAFPCHIVAAECDPLRDSSLKFAERLAWFGTPFGLEVCRGMGHAFMGYGRMIDEVERVADRVGEFVRDVAARNGAILGIERNRSPA